MSRQSKGSQFVLEELEPRVLLSANLGTLATGAAFLGSTQNNHVIYDSAVGRGSVAENNLAYHGGAAGGDIFAGMESAPVPAATQTSGSVAGPSSITAGSAGNASDSAGTAGASQTATTQAQQSATVAGANQASASSQAATSTTTLAATSVSDGGIKARELVTILKGANAPPIAALSAQDLHSYIQDLLASATASFTSTEQLASVSLGGLIQLNGVQLTVSATLTGGVWSGSVTISAASGTLFPGKNFSGTIASSTSDPAVTGTYTIGGNYSLRVASTATVKLNLGEALTISASGFNFTYDPNGAANQTLGTISTATATSAQFANLPTATLSNFVLRADGLAFDAFTLTSTPAATPSLGNLITATSATLTVSAFNVSFGYGASAASLSGTVALTVSGVKLFPTAGLVQFQADSVTAAYSFAGFDGTSPTGTLSLTISGFKLGLGEALQLTTSDNVVLTPGQTTMGTIASATISSPQFTGLGSITVTNVAIRQDGFSLGSATWASNGAVSIGDIISASGVTLTLTNVSLNYGTAPSFGGSIAVSATDVVLFPGIPILNLHLGNISGLYSFGAFDLIDPSIFHPSIPHLSLHIPNLDIPLGDFLTIHLGTIDLTPGFATMLHLPSVDLIPNLFSGLPHFNLSGFDLTQVGFTLGNFTVTLPTAVTIGNFISLSNLTIDVRDFSINKTLSLIPSGTVTVTLGNLTLFPGTSLVTSSFTNLKGVFDFSSLTAPGRFTFTADSITLGIAGQLTIAAQNIVITPSLSTLTTIGSASLSFPLLEGLQMTLSGLDVTRTGFTIASASATFGTDLNLGGLLSLTAPVVTLTNINYAFGGTLSGTVGFDTASAKLHLGSALDTSASHLGGTYNLATRVLNVTVDAFGLNVAGFATLSGTSASLSYTPGTDGTAKILVGVTGIEAFLGTGTGSNRVGIDLTGGTLALAVFKAADSSITYALDAKGTVSLLGLPANSLAASGTIEFRKNTAGAVAQVVTVGGTSFHLDFAGNEESAMGQGVSLSVGTFVSVSGDFSFQQYSPDNGTTNYVVVGATKLNATVAAGGVSLGITGASLGLLIKAGATSDATSYALVANGGTDSLTGVTGLSLTGTGLAVRVRHGFDPAALTTLPSSITTPSGSVSLNFAGVGGSSSDVTDVEGNISLTIANFVSISGDFGFQQFTSAGTTYLAIGATGASIILGNSSANLTVSGASLGLVVAPGSSGSPATFALEASGNASLNGVSGLTVNASSVTVRVRRGLDVSGAASVPNSVMTSGGAVTLNFADLGAGTTDLSDVRGHLTLAVTGFGSLEGDFGFQSFTDGKTGAQTIALGVSGATIVLGTSSTNLTVSNATFGAIIRPGVNTTPTTYALQATGSTAVLNGAGDLSVSASNLIVRIRNGLDLTTVSGTPTSIQTSGASVTLDFSGLGAGSSNVSDVQGNVSVSVGSFVTLSGSFGFQSYTVNSDHYLAIGAKNLTATLAAGSVNLTVANASVGLLVKEGTPSSYALVVKGSSNPADTALNGVPDLSLSASNLLVRARSGLDVSALPSGVPAAVHTSAGDVALDFTGLGAGTTAVTDVQGHLTLSVANFVSLEGDFGFQKFGTGDNTALAIGATHVNAVLGTSSVNVSVTGASLGILIKPGANTTPTSYALVAKGGVDALNGVPDLSISSSGLTVRVRKGLDPTSLAGAPTSVQVAGGGSVDLSSAFTGLGSSDVTEVTGTVTINVANFVTLSGTFSFTKQVSGTTTKILIGATNVDAFVGAADQSLGVRISNASFGLVIYRNSTTTGSTYALQASANVQTVGLPADVSLTGTATVAVNTTGAAVSETIPNVGSTVTFTNGTLGTPDQRNIRTFGGSLTFSVGSVFSLTGDFSFSRSVSGNTTKLMIGAAHVGTPAGSTVTADGGTDTFNLSNGTLGLVFFSTNGVSSGYSLIASATATVAVGSALSGNATLTIRRNTTTSAQNENVIVGSTSVPVIFSASEVQTGTTTLVPFQQTVLSNASISIDNTLIVTAAQGTQTTPVTGASTTALTGVTLTLQNGGSTPQVLFTISAGSADYTTFTASVTSSATTGTSLPAPVDRAAWAVGDVDLKLTNVTFSIGTFVSFSAASIDLQHYSVTVNSVASTVNSFSFTNAAITFYANGQSMVTLGGSPRFHFSTADGFKLDSFTNPTFSFLGQSLGGGAGGSSNAGFMQAMSTDASSPSRAAAVGDTTYALGPITLVNPGVSLSNFAFKFADSSPSGSVNVSLSAQVTLSAATAAIGNSSSPLHASLTNVAGSFDVTATFDLLHLTALPTIGANGFTVKADRFDIAIGSFLTITATGTTQTPLLLNPSASATQDLISFGTLSAKLNLGAVSIAGGASNFAIEGDGSFLAKPGFAVTASLGAAAGNPDASSLSWPSWLPLKSASVTLYWANFNANPTQFIIQLSATVELNDIKGLQMNVSGSVTNAIIDPNLVAQGQFPITSIDAIAIGVSGNLYGGTVTGKLVGGIVRVDANGNTVDGFGNISGTTTPAVGTVKSAFYAGIEGGFNFAGEEGFNIMVGLSDYGPLQVYVEADVPVPLGPDGFFLSNFRGAVTFGDTFPNLQISNPLQATDALQLRQPGFNSPANLTAAQWEAQLRIQVIQQVMSSTTPLDGWANLLTTKIVIQAGATLYFGSADAFRVDGDVFLDTSGKFLIIGSATIGETLSRDVRLYADVSTPTPSFLFLTEMPSQSTPTPVVPPVLSVYGIATFSNANNVFKISVAGGADLDVLGGLVAHVQATVVMTFTSTAFNITLTNASFSVPSIQSDPLGTVSGTLTVQNTNGSIDIWGGLLLVPNLKGLESAGLYAGGQVFIKLNTTSTVKQVTLDNGSLTLDPQAFSLFINGQVDFKLNGQQAFELKGTLTLQINPTSLTVFVNAQLLLGPNPATPLLTFNANGLIYVQLQATASANIGFAAKMTLTMGGSVPNGVVFGENWLLVVNTTGADITFTIPAPVATSPPSPPIPTVMGPDYSSSNPLALTSYEVVTNGVRTLVIPNGPPAGGLNNYATWTPAVLHSPYIIVLGRGTMSVANTFTFTGSINIVGGSGSSGFVFSLDANADLALKANGSTVFNFHVVGGLQLSNAGVAAALNVSLSGGVPSNLGFSFGGNGLTFQLQLNTTGSAVTINGIAVSAGTGGLFANIHITGDLIFLGGVVDLKGTFDLTVTGASLQLAINADITFLNATLHASGFAGIYYDSSPGLALSIQLSLPGGAQGIAPVPGVGSNFVIKGTFTLQINTSAITRNGIAPGFRVSVTNIGVYLFGFNLSGSLSISMSSAGFAIDIQNLTLNLFGFASISLSGYVHPDGGFLFTGTAGFQFGDHVFGIGGSISVSISNNGFSASVSGWVAAFGVEISGSGGITISGGSVDIDVTIYVVLFPAVNIDTPDVYVDLGWFGGFTIPGIHIHTPAVVVSGTAHFHLGSTAPAPAAATVQLPPPPPPPPTLAGVNNGQLVLYLGADVGSRTGATTPLTAENYSLTLDSTQSGSQTIQVTALGTSMTFPGVTSILVRDTQTGNDTISIAGGITVPVNITLGSGSNNVTTGSGAATVAVNGSTSSVISTGNNATVTVAGGGSNNISTGSSSTVTVSGGGANRITVNGNTSTANNVTISGNGNNQVTVVGTTPTTISVTGNGANQLTTGGGASTVTLRGSGANQVTTGAGFATVNDQSIGGTTVKAGSGGGKYIGGLTSGGTAFPSKGSSSVTATAGNFAVQVSGYANYTLSNTSLTYGAFGLTLNGVNNVALTAGSSATTNTFTLVGWTGSAALTGAGSNNSLTLAPPASASSVNYVLSDSQLRVTGGVTQTITLTGIQSAMLNGASAGTNTFDVSGWTGGGALLGPSGTTNTVIATNDVATFALSDVKFDRAGHGSIALNGIQNATLTGGAGVNAFAVSNWSGSATFDGAGGNDTYTLTLTGSGGGIVNVTDTGSTTGDTLTISAPKNFFVTSTQVRIGTQRVNYSGVETLSINGTTNALSYNVQSTHAGTSTSVVTGGSTSVISVGSNAGVVPVAAGSLTGIQGALSISGGGTMTVDDTASATTKSGTLTPTTLAGFGMGSGGITYAGLSALTVSLGAGGNTIAINDINASTVTTVNGGSSANDTVNLSSAADFNGTLNLTAFEHGTVNVTGNFNGTLNDSGPGHLEIVAIGANSSGSLAATGHLNVGSIDNMTVAQDLAGALAVSGRLANLSVGRDLSGSVTESGVVTQFTIGRDLTSSGTITVSNPTAALAAIGTMNVAGNLAGHLTVSGSVTTLSVGGSLSGVVSVGDTLGTMNVTGNVSGSVTESGTIAQLTIGGSLTSAGTITVSNSGDSTQYTGAATFGNITAMTVGHNLAGTLLVTGTLGSLTVGTAGAGDTLSGTVTVRAALTSLVVNGDISSTGKVIEAGPVNAISITGSLALGGLIRVFNTADPSGQVANVTTLAVGLDVAGTILVSGRLAKLTVGRDLSGSVTESGTVTTLTVTGNVTSSGTITVSNPTAAAANITALTVGGNVAGSISVTGNLTTGTITGDVSGTIAVVDTITTLAIGGDVSGNVTEHGTINLLTIGGSLTSAGTINATNAALGNITTMSVGRNLAGALNVSGNVGSLSVGTTTASDKLSGTVTIGGNLGTLTVTGDVTGHVTIAGNFSTGTVTGNVSGVVDVAGTLTTLRVAGNVSGSVTEHGTVSLLDIGGSLTATGTINATNATAASGNITTLNVGADLAGTVLVSGALTTLTVGHDVSGVVTESGTINALTIHGSLTAIGTAPGFAKGTINALNATAALGKINTMTVDHDLAGEVHVSGDVGTLHVGTATASDKLSGLVDVGGNLGTMTVTGDVSGTVKVAGNFSTGTVTGNVSGLIDVTGTLTKLTVNADVSGTVTEHGTIDQFTIGGSLTSTGKIFATNPTATAGNINTLALGVDLAGTVQVSGALTTLTVGRDVSGTVTESGTINLLTIGGSLTSSGIINALNSADPSQVPAVAQATLGNVNTMRIDHDLAGHVNVSGTFTSLTVGTPTVAGNLSGTVDVKGALTTAKVTGDVAGTVNESGLIDSFTIGGSLTGAINAKNPQDSSQVLISGTTTLASINTMTIGHNLSGKLTVTGNVGSLTVGTTLADSLSGTVAVNNTITNLSVAGDVSGSVTESGTITTLTINGSLTGTGLITAANTNDPSQLPLAGGATFANITTMTVGQNIAGTLSVTGNVTTLIVGGNVSGTVLVRGTLTTFKVTGDVSGTVTESGTINLLTIGGSLTGTIYAKNTQDSAQVPPSGQVTLANITTMTIGHNLSGLLAVTGNVGSLTVGTTLADSLSGTVAVKNTLTNLVVTGDISGSVTESGTIATLTIGGSLAASGLITGSNTNDPSQLPLTAVPTYANITTMTVGQNLAGKLTVTGNVATLIVGGSVSGTVLVQGTLTTMKVTGDVSGSVTESGTINLLTIGGSLTGTINAKNTQDSAQVPPSGQVTLANITTMTIGHNLSGLLAVTGNVGSLTVGTTLADSLSGTVAVKNTLTNLVVTGDISGSVTESGTIATLTIGGSLTATGTITAANTNDPNQLPPLDPPWLGNIVTFAIAGNLAGHVLVTGDLTTLTVGGNLSGVVLVQNTLKTLNVTGDVSGSVTESGTINALTIGGSLTSTGLIKAVNVVPALGNIVTFSIGQDFAGTVIVSGNLHSLAIVHGSMTPTGRLTVGSLDVMTIGPDQLSVGQNMAGIITVLGTFQSLRVAGGTPGTIIAGHIGTLAVYGGFGPVVLNVTENGITRHVELAVPGAPYPHPDNTTVAGNPYVNVQFFYESGSLANPQLTARITNNVSTARSQYDLSLVTYNDTAKFNLAQLDAVGVSGVRNVVVEGDLLTGVTASAAGFFRSTPAAMPGGIRLPVDDLAGVSIRDYAPNSYIQVHSVMGVAFGSYTDKNGRLFTGVSAHLDDAKALFAAGTLFVQAADTFRVAFADLSTQQVALFIVDDPHGGHFDEASVLLAVQSVVTANAAGTANIVTPSNVARGAATALVTTMPTYDKNGNLKESAIQTIAIRGDGASIDTKQWISSAITSTGPLGDLNLRSNLGITDITAPGIFGSIASGGQILGTIQTTGLRTDPITDAVTNVSADIGRLYVITTNKGPVVVATTIDSKGQDVTGRIIVRGNLISTVTGKISGVIAVQGNLGTTRGTGSATTRFGGMTIEGGLSGSIVVLGQQLGDVTIHGGVEETGNYAVSGGMLGNLVVDGIEAGGRIISGGQIGDATQGTTFTASGSNKGIIAALGKILWTKNVPGGSVFNNLGASAGSVSAVAVKAIFTQNGVAVALDVTGLDLQGLASILIDLRSLVVNSSGNLTGPIP